MVVRPKHLAVNLNKIVNNCSNRVALDGNPWTWSNTRNRMQTTEFKIAKNVTSQDGNSCENRRKASLAIKAKSGRRICVRRGFSPLRVHRKYWHKKKLCSIPSRAARISSKPLPSLPHCGFDCPDVPSELDDQFTSVFARKGLLINKPSGPLEAGKLTD
jgi:hypothetical protein